MTVKSSRNYSAVNNDSPPSSPLSPPLDNNGLVLLRHESPAIPEATIACMDENWDTNTFASVSQSLAIQKAAVSGEVGYDEAQLLAAGVVPVVQGDGGHFVRVLFLDRRSDTFKIEADDRWTVEELKVSLFTWGGILFST